MSRSACHSVVMPVSLETRPRSVESRIVRQESTRKVCAHRCLSWSVILTTSTAGRAPGYIYQDRVRSLLDAQQYACRADLRPSSSSSPTTHCSAVAAKLPAETRHPHLWSLIVRRLQAPSWIHRVAVRSSESAMMIAPRLKSLHGGDGQHQPQQAPEGAYQDLDR